MTRLPAADVDRLVFCLVKQNERYVFVYDEASKEELLRTLGRFATTPGLSFTWNDAARIAKRVREA